MNYPLLLRTVFAHLYRYKVRTSLMVLGVALGVLAMATIQTLASSARAGFFAYVERAYPADVVVLSGDGFMGRGYRTENLRLPDVEAVRATIPEIVDWDPVVRAGAKDIKHAGSDVRVPVFGHSDRAEYVRRRGVREGAFFDRVDVDVRSRVALLGTTTAQQLFGAESAVGRELFIDSIPFVIKGVLEPVGVDPHGIDLDNAVWIPFTTAMDELLGIDFISEASLVLGAAGRAETVARRVEEIMRERHGIFDGYDDDFSVITPVYVRDRLEGSFETINLFVKLVITTIFSVAGVIVLSVMSISIKQRSAEIGLRKALGARPRDLKLQIALEVLVVSGVASAVGVASAWLVMSTAAPALAESFGMNGLDLSPAMVSASIAAAVVTAAIGGVVPAVKAARLDPIEALR